MFYDNFNQGSEKRLQIVIDLKTPQGNPFFLINKAKELSDKLGWSEEKKNNIIKEMKKSNNTDEQVIRIFISYFGQHITIER